MSVTAAPGFVASGIHCGVKRRRPDLALIASADGAPVSAAAVFTTNRFCAAPVQASRARLAASGGKVAAVIVNSGNANAGTGEPGMRNAEAMIAATAAALGCDPAHVLVCSTGLIGKPLPMDAILGGIPRLAKERSADGGEKAAKGILTTDSKPKQAVIEGAGFTVGGMAKGCGMLSPNMATMLAFLTTDADADPETLKDVLAGAVADTFNALSVDGATSTNDTVILLASGKAGRADRAALAAAVRAVCEDLALQMARDAEGMTKVVRVKVSGAASDGEARHAARRIAENQLVKCSWHGGDPYWGRILAEAGAAGVDFQPERSVLSYGGIVVARGGVEADHDQDAARAYMGRDEIEVCLDLGVGSGLGHIVTVDLGPGYIRENSATS
jgi:glutamate N-acetyltransferase / amino-acid N-acetyltransferase